MTTPSRFAVPLEALDAVHVCVAEQVSEEPQAVRPPDGRAWGGALDPTLDGGGGWDGDGD